MSACSENKEDVIEIEDKNFSGMLMIQKVEDNASSEEMTKIVTDKQKIEKILTMIEGLKVKETDTETTTKELKSQDSYFFGFAEGEKMESAKPIPYSFIVLEDGTFIFNNLEINIEDKPHMTIEKHKDLLSDLNQLLEVNF